MTALMWLQIIAAIPSAMQGAAEVFQAIAEATGRQANLTPEEQAAIKAACDAKMVDVEAAHKRLQETP